MSLIVVFLLLIIGLAGAGFSLTLIPENPFAAAVVFCIGILSIISSYVLDKCRIEQEEANRRRRIAELTQRLWTSRQSLQITGNTFAILIANILLMGLPGYAIYAMIYAGYSDSLIWTKPVSTLFLMCAFFLMGTFLLIFLLIGAARCIALLGKPVYELSKDGIKTPIYGEIDWKDIEGIFLETTVNIGGVQFYFIEIHVPNNLAVLKNVHWTERIVSLFRLSASSLGKIRIPVSLLSERPEVIAEVAIYLWRQATGATHHWNPYVSDKFNEAEKRISDFMKKYSSNEENGEITESELLTLEAELKQIHIDMETMHSETEKSHQQIQQTLKWLPIILVCILVYLIAVFVTDYLI